MTINATTLLLSIASLGFCFSGLIILLACRRYITIQIGAWKRRHAYRPAPPTNYIRLIKV